MKAKIVIATSALLLGTITTANADLYIESPRGITQSEWSNSNTYKNFVCPADYWRGEGVDMNFTSDKTDDFWFVKCEPIVIFTPKPLPINASVGVAPTVSLPQLETNTVTVVPSDITATNNTTTAVTPDTVTATTETTTATIASVTVQSLYTQIMALFTQLLALIAKLNG